MIKEDQENYDNCPEDYGYCKSEYCNEKINVYCNEWFWLYYNTTYCPNQ